MVLTNYVNNTTVDLDTMLSEVKYTHNQTTNLKVIEYPESLIKKLAKELGKSESTVWVELLKIENANAITEVADLDEFVEAVKNRQAYIYIPEPFRSEQSKLVNSVLTEEDRLGFELGSRGTGNILEEVIYQVVLLFDKESSEFKRMKSNLRKYYVRVHDDKGSLLYEKEQTY